MGNVGFEILLIVILVIANGVFSMAEMAVVSARKARLRQRASLVSTSSAMNVTATSTGKALQHSDRALTPTTPVTPGTLDRTLEFSGSKELRFGIISF
jgi:CBS domain containing-hemolysin-like protein